MGSLGEVRRCLELGEEKTFRAMRVSIVNFSAINKFPRKFFYVGCTHPIGSRLCSKTVGTCEHDSYKTGEYKSMYRFDVYLFDGYVGAGTDCPPLRAAIFQAASTVLDMDIESFCALEADDQLEIVQEKTAKMLEADVTLKTRKDKKLILEKLSNISEPAIDPGIQEKPGMRRQYLQSPSTPSTYGTPGSSYGTPIMIGEASLRSSSNKAHSSSKTPSAEELDGVRQMLQIAMDKLDLKSQ